MVNNMEDQGENYAQVRRDIDELKSMELTLENYKKWAVSIENKNTIIISQIENLRRDYVGENEDLKLKQKSDAFQRALGDNYVHRDVYDILMKIKRILTDSFSWKVIQNEMYFILHKKMMDLMDSVNAFAIKRDALKEMKEMQNKLNEVFLQSMQYSTEMAKEVVNNRLERIDDKILSSFKLLSQQHRMEMNETLGYLKRFMEAMTKKVGAKLEIVEKTQPLELDEDEIRTLKEKTSKKFKGLPKSIKKSISTKKIEEVRDERNDDIDDDFERRE